MNLLLFEDAGYRGLLPLTWLRPAWELWCGRGALLDKLRRHAGARMVGALVRPVLRDVMAARPAPQEPDPDRHWCLVNGRTLLTGDVALPVEGSAWVLDGQLVAATVSRAEAAQVTPELVLDQARLDAWARRLQPERPPPEVQLIRYPWEPVQLNEQELRRECRQGGVHEGRIYPGAHLLNTQEIHIAPGAVIKPGAVLDAESGPIHIDRDVVIQPNAVVEGPCFIGTGSIVRPGATIRGSVTIGPVCKVGGEVEGSILQGYANKQHDGFLGHSYVCPWVNLGADTITSDLKNTYGTVRVRVNGANVETGRHFVGSMIADHAKTGIGTILPTGCVIGVAANILTRGTVPGFVPSFAWLTDAGMTPYRIEKAIEIARIVMGRRDIELTSIDEKLLETTAALAAQAEATGWPT
jgi:UDP-N-acetylglucosamine diphosphorylase/glucosamine-1-phosphate N-acetyltransferase